VVALLRGDTPTLVVVDEAWHWLRYPQAAAELEEMARRFRKRYGGLQLGTQHIYDLDSSGSAQVIRDTADLALLFRQRGSATGAVSRLFELNELERPRTFGHLLRGERQFPFPASDLRFTAGAAQRKRRRRTWPRWRSERPGANGHEVAILRSDARSIGLRNPVHGVTAP